MTLTTDWAVDSITTVLNLVKYIVHIVVNSYGLCYKTILLNTLIKMTDIDIRIGRRKQQKLAYRTYFRM